MRKESKNVAPDNRSRDAQRATEIMELAISALKKQMNALTLPLNAFELKAVREETTVCTDGLRLFFNTDYVLGKYQNREMGSLKNEIAHIVFHGLLGHFEIWRDYEQKKLISAVMDIQVERLLRFLGIARQYSYYLESDELDEYSFGIYYRALKNKKFFESIKYMRDAVESDDHDVWMRDAAEAGPAMQAIVGSASGADGKGDDAQGAAENGRDVATVWTEIREALFGKNVTNNVCEIDSGRWKEFLREWGNGSSDESQEIARKKESRNNYRELLREIVSVNEMAKERDNIDYAIYQYGLSLYSDVPLIEPLECVEEKKLDNLVIALDTSGSCSGKIIEEFVSDTAEIFQEIGAESVFESIYLIQCDADIQCEERYGNVYELQAALGESFRAYGFGGTDFRPVFRRVDELQREGEKINALLYFSDGYGEFPREKPEYPTYYIVPVWRGEELDPGLIPDWVRVSGLEMEG